MNLLPNVGIGSVRFGMSPDELLEIFTEEQKHEGWMGGNLNHSLMFHGIVFGFNKYDSSAPLPDSRLIEIRVSGREGVTLWDKEVSDWTKPSLIKHSDENKIPYEDLSNGDLSFESLSLDLSFDEQEKLNYLEMWSNP